LDQAGLEATEELRILAEDGDNRPMASMLRGVRGVLYVIAGDTSCSEEDLGILDKKITNTLALKVVIKKGNYNLRSFLFFKEVLP